MKYILLLFLFTSCGLSINQEVESCNDEKHFQVRTYVKKSYFMKRPDHIYTSGTWAAMNDCLTAEQVDSAKRAEYAKAETFIKQYKKIK